jgi:nitrogen regulatory protein PII
MKRVEVIMPPAQLDEVKEALAEVGLPGMSVSETRVFDESSRRREVYRGSSYVVDFTLKVKIDIVVGDDAVCRILDVLEKSAGTWQPNDRRVSVTDVVEVVRIRTGERGQEAVDYPASSLHVAEA